MLGDLQKKNFTEAFKTLDADSDGLVDRPDYKIVAMTKTAGNIDGVRVPEDAIPVITR